MKEIKGLEIYTEKNNVNGMYTLKAWAVDTAGEYLVHKAYDTLDDYTYTDFYNYVKGAK